MSAIKNPFAVRINNGNGVHVTSCPVNRTAGGRNTIEFWAFIESPGGMLWCDSIGYDFYMVNNGIGFNTFDSQCYGVDVRPLVGRWVHFALVVVNGNMLNCKMYLNGELQTLSHWANGTGAGNKTLNGSFTLGSGHAINANSYRANCRMDEFRIWNRELTQDEIRKRMNKYLVGNEPGLISLLRFDEGAGTLTVDDSPSKRNGSFLGGVTWIPGEIDLTTPIMIINQQIEGTNFRKFESGFIKLFCDVITEEETQQLFTYKIKVNGEAVEDTGDVFITPRKLQKSISKELFTLDNNELMLEVTDNTGWTERFVYEIQVEHDDRFRIHRRFDFDSQSEKIGNLISRYGRGLVTTKEGNSEAIVEVFTEGKGGVESVVVNSSHEYNTDVLFQDSFNSKGDMGSGKLYEYVFPLKRFTDIKEMFLNDPNAKALFEIGGKVYTFNGGFQEISNAVLTEGNFNTYGINDFKSLLDLTDNHLLDPKRENLDNGYLWRTFVKASKYGGIKSLRTVLRIRDFGTYRAWEDGSFAKSAEEYRRPEGNLHVYEGHIGSGVYRIQPNPLSPPFDVYCDMETEGGGWVLIDNKLAGLAISSRQEGACLSPDINRGSFIPELTWDRGELMCRSSHYNGQKDYVIFRAISDTAKLYPTQRNGGQSGSGSGGHWEILMLNGNTNQGTGSWVFEGSGRIGTIWIGNGSSPTAAVAYMGTSTGLGANYGQNPSGSSWVR